MLRTTEVLWRMTRCTQLFAPLLGVALILTLYSGVLHAQQMPGVPAIGPLDVRSSPFIFSGTSRMEGQNSSRLGTGQEPPQDYWRWELVPTVTTYGVPFSLSVLLSSQQSDVRQNINSIGLFLNPQMYQGILQDQVSAQIDQLTESDQVKQVQALKETYSLENITGAALSDSMKAHAPEGLKDSLPAMMDKYNQLKKLETIRNEGVASHLDDLKSMGMMSGAEKFFSYFPTLAVGVTYPNYTPLTLTGVPVTGADVEFVPGDFYLAVTGGQTQKAVVRDTQSIAYQNTLWAGAIGIGKRNDTHFHVTALYARDDATSVLQDTTLADSNLLFRSGPKANYLLGADLKIIADPHFSVDAEIVGSMLTSDTKGADVTNNDIPSWVRKLVDPKISSFVDYAYILHTGITIPESGSKLSGMLRRVGPGFYSLGSPNLRNDNFRYEGKFDQSFAKRQVTVGTFIRNEHDNLIPWKQMTTSISSYGVSLGLNLRKLPYLRLSYSPYFQSSEITDSALMATPGSDSLRFENKTSLISIVAGYSFAIEKLVTSTNISFSKQDTKTRYGLGDFSSTNWSLNEIVNFPFPLSLSGTLGLIEPHATPDTANAIISIDLSGSYTAYDVWTNTVGFTIAKQAGVDNKTGFYISTSFPLWKAGTLDIRAEKNIYTNNNPYPDALPGTFQNPNYNEFILRAVLTKSW
jgi:hypothetical protein